MEREITAHPGGGPVPHFMFMWTMRMWRFSVPLKPVVPMENTFWGDRYGKLQDPHGHDWGIATHLEDLSEEELQKRSDEYMAAMAKGGS